MQSQIRQAHRWSDAAAHSTDEEEINMAFMVCHGTEAVGLPQQATEEPPSIEGFDLGLVGFAGDGTGGCFAQG
jgi:hypothetical protein